MFVCLCTGSLDGVRQDPVRCVVLGVVDEAIFDECQINPWKGEGGGGIRNTVLSKEIPRVRTPRVCLTWNVSKVPVDAEVGVRGDDAALEDLLTHHRGEGVLGCVHVGLDQPGVLWTFEGEHGDVRHTLRQNHQTASGN